MNNYTDSTLFIITTSFPYGYGEVSMENEIKVLSRCFSFICILPQYKTGRVRELPPNVTVNNSLCEISLKLSIVSFLKHSLLLSQILFNEFYRTEKKIEFIKQINYLKSSIFQCILKSELVHQVILQKQTEKKYFYSSWMNDGALIFSILKSQKIISSFVFRQRGFDLYDFRQKNNYIPFRYFNFKNCSKIICISQDGYNYLKSKNIFSEKIYLSHLGVFDNGINPLVPENIFTIVSSSNIIPLKRVHLIVKIIEKLNFPVKWVHFGDGFLKTEILKMLPYLKSNVQVELRGQVPNSEIIDFYKNTQVNLFIHLSETEGGAAVAIQEAASFGIPIIGTNAGGIPDIVNEKTGMLIPVNFDIDETVKLINEFRFSKNTIEFRNNVKQFWKKHFNAEINYTKFAELLKQ
jgi:glycosyltransferase involved in cell wall biosynthesis